MSTAALRRATAFENRRRFRWQRVGVSTRSATASSAIHLPVLLCRLHWLRCEDDNGAQWSAARHATTTRKAQHRPPGAHHQSSSMSGGGRPATLGCIGKCSSGLTPEELDRITDHVQWTLGSAQGRRMFRKYLTEARRDSELACLELHELCCQSLDNERVLRAGATEPGPLLLDEARRALERAEALDDVPELDLALLERFGEALDTPSRDALLAVLEETKARLMSHLRQAHRGFRVYARQPCPRGPGPSRPA